MEVPPCCYTLPVNGGDKVFDRCCCSRCVGGRDRQVKVSLQHLAATSVMLQGVLLDSAVFMADGVDYLVAAVYKDDDTNNGNDYCTPYTLFT